MRRRRAATRLGDSDGPVAVSPRIPHNSVRAGRDGRIALRRRLQARGVENARSSPPPWTARRTHGGVHLCSAYPVRVAPVLTRSFSTSSRARTPNVHSTASRVGRRRLNGARDRPPSTPRMCTAATGHAYRGPADGHGCVSPQAVCLARRGRLCRSPDVRASPTPSGGADAGVASREAAVALERRCRCGRRHLGACGASSLGRELAPCLREHADPRDGARSQRSAQMPPEKAGGRECTRACCVPDAERRGRAVDGDSGVHTGSLTHKACLTHDGAADRPLARISRALALRPSSTATLSAWSVPPTDAAGQPQ